MLESYELRGVSEWVSEERGDAIYFNEQQESKTTRHLGRNILYILCMKHEYYIFLCSYFICQLLKIIKKIVNQSKYSHITTVNGVVKWKVDENEENNIWISWWIWERGWRVRRDHNDDDQLNWMTCHLRWLTLLRVHLKNSEFV
jgi:hypothetical protein